MNKRRILALFLSICLVLALDLSYLYIFSHSRHQCTGKECIVCERIQLAEHLIEQIKNALAGVAVLVAVIFFVCHSTKMTYLYIVSDTLVKRKVRLNN